MKHEGRRKGVLRVSVSMMMLLATLTTGMGCAHQKQKSIPPIMEWIDRGDEVCMTKQTAEDLSIYLLELESNP